MPSEAAIQLKLLSINPSVCGWSPPLNYTVIIPLGGIIPFWWSNTHLFDHLFIFHNSYWYALSAEKLIHQDILSSWIMSVGVF